MAHIEYCPTTKLAHIACVAPFRAAGLQAGKRVHKLKVRAACASSPRSRWFSNEKDMQLPRQCARTVTAAVTQSTGEVIRGACGNIYACCAVDVYAMYTPAVLHRLGSRHDQDQSVVCVQRYARVLRNYNIHMNYVLNTGCVTGNICRSPAAGVMMKKVVQHSGLADDWVIDSCGTGGSGHENW